MAWHADPLANNKASNTTTTTTNTNTIATNGNNTNPNPQGGVAGQQFQSLLGENSDLLQRQLAAASHSDPQQHLLAAQLALQAQQNNPFAPWGSAAASSTTPAGSSNTASNTNGRSPSLASKPIPPGMVGMGPTPSNPYGGMGFASLHHPHLPSHHHPLSSVGFPGGAAQFLNPAASASQFHQGIPSVMHQMVQMQMIQQQIQQMQQLQQHMQQQANAFSAANNAPAATSSSSTAPTSADAAAAAAGNHVTGSSDLFSMMKNMPGGMPGLGNPLPFAMPPTNTIGNVPPPSSLTNTTSSTAMGGNPLSSASCLQQLLRKSAISPEDQAGSSTTTNKLPPTTSTTKSGSSNPSGSTTQKSRSVLTKRADESSVAVEPTVHDILSGRGNYVNNHDGNKNFRALVNSQRVMYVAAPKEYKPEFAKKIIEALKSLNPPGRFLQQDPDTKLWYELDEKKAMAKTRQALREGAPDVYKQITNADGTTTTTSIQNSVGDVAIKEEKADQDKSLVKSEPIESKTAEEVSQVPSVENGDKDSSDSNSSSAPNPKRTHPEKEDDASKSKKSESSEQPKKKKKQKTNSNGTASLDV